MGTRLSYTFTCQSQQIAILMASYPPQDGTFWKGPVPASPTPWKASSDILLECLLSARNSRKQQTRKTKVPTKQAVETKTQKNETVEAVADAYFSYSPRAKS